MVLEELRRWSRRESVGEEGATDETSIVIAMFGAISKAVHR